MSTSTIRTTYQPGENVRREAAASRARWQEERREGVDSFVESRLSEYEGRFGERGQEMCEMAGRLEEVGELAPRDLYEEVQELFDAGAEPAELAERIEQLEGEAASRYEDRQICELGIAEMTRASGARVETPVWQPGGTLKALYRFPVGGQMTAEMSEKDVKGGKAKEIAWLGRTSDVRDCAEQERLVGGIVDQVDGMEMSDLSATPHRKGRVSQPARESTEKAG